MNPVPQQSPTEVDQKDPKAPQLSYRLLHDLNAPLGRVRQSLALLREEHPRISGDDGGRYLDIATHSLDTLSRLVDGLQQCTRIDTHTLQWQNVEMHALLQRTVQDFQSEIDQSATTLQLGTLLPVYADPELLLILCKSLFSNALRFNNGDTPPVVTIAMAATTNDVTQTLSVINNGRRIADEDANTIFNALEKSAAADGSVGNGLGLTHCLQICHKHGWSLDRVERCDALIEFRVTMPGSTGQPPRNQV